MKPFDELIAEAERQGHAIVAARLAVSVEMVCSWYPRERTLPDGRTIVDTGVEPSGGFVACALALLRCDNLRV